MNALQDVLDTLRAAELVAARAEEDPETPGRAMLGYAQQLMRDYRAANGLPAGADRKLETAADVRALRDELQANG